MQPTNSVKWRGTCVGTTMATGSGLVMDAVQSQVGVVTDGFPESTKSPTKPSSGRENRPRVSASPVTLCSVRNPPDTQASACTTNALCKG
jgi:hypothetical protein